MLTNGKYIEILHHCSCYDCILHISFIIFRIMDAECTISNCSAVPLKAIIIFQNLHVIQIF
jgi:hypothetical protein